MAPTDRPIDELHVPVLRDRIVDLLAPALSRPGAVHVDGTLGMAGHALAVLEAFPQARLVGIDRDPQALDVARERLSAHADRVDLVHATYDEVADVLDDLAIPEVDGALFDLGVSSLQLDEADRGFAYAQDAPLDMRMDQSTGRSAAELLAQADVDELTRIIREHGEERFARRVAQGIVRARETAPLTRTHELVEICRAAVPAASQRSGGHPAKRTFQALRIEVNAELSGWADALPAAVGRLRTGGRIAVLSYHSLEDRITKRVLSAGATSTAPPDLPVELPEHAPYLRLLTRGAEAPSQSEQLDNPRSASARLRAAERVRDTKGTAR